MSRPLTIVLSLALLAPAGCGGEDEASPPGSDEATTATEAQEDVITRFADRDQPSIEDDVGEPNPVMGG